MSSARRSANRLSRWRAPTRPRNRRTAASDRAGSGQNMWCRTRWATSSAAARGNRRRRSQRLRQPGADDVVVVEVPVGQGGGLADVVDEGGEADDGPRGRGGVDGPQRVVPEVLAGHLVLRDPALRGEVGRDDRQQPGLLREPQPDRRPGRREQLLQLRPDPLPGEVGDQRGMVPGWRPASRARSRTPAWPPAGRRGSSAARPRGTGRRGRRRRAGSRRSRSARPPNGSTSAFGPASPAVAPPRDGVDREVAAGEVGHDVLAELHAVRPPEVRVLVLGAEGGDLEHVVVATDGHGPEAVLVDRAVEQSSRSRSGRASVARSQSAGSRPPRASRRDPPTT